MHRTRLGILALLTAGLMLGGCAWRDYGPDQATSAPTTRLIHVVVEGDNNLVGIAKRYGVAVEVIIRANDITLRDLPLAAGRRLVIPGGHLPEPVPAPVPEAPVEAPVKSSEPTAQTNDWFVPRSAWAVEPIVLARINPMAGKPNRLTIHHSNMPGDTDPDVKGVLRLIDNRHHKAIGRNGDAGACIGYHFLIARDGTVYEGRPLQYQGAHAGGDNNKLNIGICLLGDFEHGQVPATQKAAMVAVLDRLCATYGISRSQVHGHKDFNPPGTLHTECPGRFLFPLVLAYRHGQLGSTAPPATMPPMAAATRP